jgi:hypothetical protein
LIENNLNLKNLLQTDKFTPSKLHSSKLIDLLNKITKRKNSYPYTQIKKFISKELNLPTSKKVLDNLNILENYELLFLYYKLNVLIFETKVNEFKYYNNPEINKTILIIQNGSIYYQVQQTQIYHDIPIQKTYWKSNKLPEELSILTNTNDYIKCVIKNYIKFNEEKIACSNIESKTTLSRIIIGIEKYLNKKLSNSEKIYLYKNIHVILEFNCYLR